MSRGLYFYDQYAGVSHIGGVHRYKRHPEELNQALHHVRIALASEDDHPAKSETPATTINQTPTPVKQQLGKQTNDVLLTTIQRKLKTPIIPDTLFKDLDSLFIRFDDKAKTAVSSSTTKAASSLPPKSAESNLGENEQDPDSMPIQEADDEDELMAIASATPKISLPASLIIRLHSTWNDLVEDTEYKYKVWQTKTGEENWKRYLERKKIEQANAERHRAMLASKQAYNRRTTSRISVTSAANTRQQQSLAFNPQMRSNRSLSRVSFLSTNNLSPTDHNKLLKPVPQGSLESLTESIKSGVHVEFKLSVQIDQNKQQQSQIQALNEQKGVMFDVPKPIVDVHEDIIALTQTRCRRLLAEMKQKIIATVGDTNNQYAKMCKFWFYGDNHLVRNKSTLLTLNEKARAKRPKFVFSIIRKEIPEYFDLEIEIPQIKNKCYLEMSDGSSQIYYPSGRLAVIRVRSPNPFALFFDDKDSAENQFLGVVTSNGGTLVMQPNSHARFVTDSLHERGYLCNGKVGTIEKQFQWHLNAHGTPRASSTEPITHDDDEILPALLETTVQLQLNSCIQLEYASPTNIRFAFACQKEEHKYQLGAIPSSHSTPIEVPLPQPKKAPEKKLQLKSKYPNLPPNWNQPAVMSEKQQQQVERLLDGQVNIRELPMIKELTYLRKRVRNICHDWLKLCRTTLGVMDIDAYCLPDWPGASVPMRTKMTKFHESKSAKQPRHVTIMVKNDPTNNEFPQPSEREQLIRTHSARKVRSNVIENSILQFIPRSESGKNMKQKFFAKKHRPTTTLPAIKTPQAMVLQDERQSARTGLSGEPVYACPHVIRQRLIHAGPTSTILHEACICRPDHVPIIHDLELDAFIESVGRINPKQLIVIGIVNSNLRQTENNQGQQADESYEMLQTLHFNLNYGRSQISICRLSTNDEYRCLIYDLAEATKQSSLHGPLLVRRHNVQPGFVLIYQHGQVIFGDSIFNGYGRNIQDLKKQLNRMRQAQIALPEEFKFISDQRRSNTAVLKSI